MVISMSIEEKQVAYEFIWNRFNPTLKGWLEVSTITTASIYSRDTEVVAVSFLAAFFFLLLG